MAASTLRSLAHRHRLRGSALVLGALLAACGNNGGLPNGFFSVGEDGHVAAVSPGEPPEVTGSYALTYITDDTVTTVPMDLTGRPGERPPVEASYWDGTDTFLLRDVTPLGEGRFAVPGVGDGPLYLRTGDEVVATRGRFADLGYTVLGRPEAHAAAVPDATLTLALTGLAPWQADVSGASDELQLFSAGAGAACERLERVAGGAPTAGATSVAALSFSYPGYCYGGALGARDTTYISQLTVKRHASGLYYRSVARSAARPGADLIAGQTVTLRANLTPPRTEKVSVRWGRGDFAATRTPNRPAGNTLHTLRVLAQPPGAEGGFGWNAAPSLLFTAAVDDRSETLADLSFGNPFPTSWPVGVLARTTLPVVFREANTDITLYEESASLRPIEEGTLDLAPRVGPVRAVQLGDAPILTQSVTAKGPLLLRWTPPAQGTAHLYDVTAFRLRNFDPTVYPVAAVTTTEPSVTFPLLQKGFTYVFAITAISRPGQDTARAPYYWGTTWSYTTILTAPVFVR